MEVLIRLIQECSISRATKVVKNMIEDLQKRNKLPKIAYKSLAEWNTVQEHLLDDLANCSEDDKKLKAAEARALGKRKIQSKKKLFLLFGSSVKWSDPGHFLKAQGKVIFSFLCTLFLHIFDA